MINAPTKQPIWKNRSRRNNLRITGIPEVQHETWENTEAMVKSVLKDKLELTCEPRIERAHRVGRVSQFDGSSGSNSRSRPILCRLYDWKEKENILKRARICRPTGIFVNEDVAEATMAKRKEQLPMLKQAKTGG